MTTEKDKASNDKTAEEIERERIEKEADNYAFEVPYNGTKDFYDMKKYEGYIAGATHEYNRSTQQLKEYKDVIRELLPFVEERSIGIISLSSSNKDKACLLRERARKLIDQTDTK